MRKKLTKCIVCGKSNARQLFQTYDRMFDIKGSFTVKKCGSCGLLFLDPQPSSTILKKHYPSTHYYSYKDESDSGFFYKLRSYLVKHYYEPNFLSKVFSVMVQNVPALPKKRKGKILDVGCGTGDTLVLLKELGWDVYGLEIDQNAVAVAKKRGLRNVTLGGYARISLFKDNYFDVIRLYHVIEHIPNPSECLRLLYKKLKPGGEVILGTPNFQSMTSSIFGRYWYNLDTPRHVFIFSPKTLSMLVRKEGFSYTIIEFCSAGGIIGSLVYAVNNFRKKRLDPNNFLWLFFLLYPFEWFLDKLKRGDIMILRAIK